VLICSERKVLLADCWLIAGGWFVLREKYCWLVTDNGWFLETESKTSQYQ
jgi:hypothetical protein